MAALVLPAGKEAGKTAQVWFESWLTSIHGDWEGFAALRARFDWSLAWCRVAVLSRASLLVGSKDMAHAFERPIPGGAAPDRQEHEWEGTLGLQV